MACGCPSDVGCTCTFTGDAYTGGSGDVGDPVTVENTPLVLSSPNNTIDISQSGTKDHTAELDVAVSADADNAIELAVDGLLVDKCSLFQASYAASGELLLADGCAAERLALPIGANHVVAASGAAWGQRPLLSADGGNASSIGTDGGIWSPAFGAVAPTWGVQTYTASDTIVPADGMLVHLDGVTAGQTLTLPPASVGQRYEVHNRSTREWQIQRQGADTIRPDEDFLGQSLFSLPSGYDVLIECLEAGVWTVQQTDISTPLQWSVDRPTTPFPGMEIYAVWGAGDTGSMVGHFRYVGSGPAIWLYLGGQDVLADVEFLTSTGSAAYVADAPVSAYVDGAGFFDVYTFVHVSSASASTIYYSFTGPGVAASDLWSALALGVANGHAPAGLRRVQFTGPGNVVGAMRTTAGTAFFSSRRILIRPVHMDH